MSTFRKGRKPPKRVKKFTKYPHEIVNLVNEKLRMFPGLNPNQYLNKFEQLAKSLYDRSLKGNLPSNEDYLSGNDKVNFYLSEEWLKLKTKALAKYGRKCMKCERIKGEIHVDHIKPRSLYPLLELDFNNLQVLCKRCNIKKSNKNEIDYRPNVIKL